ncbi:MAG: tRNA uridine-5-carboxymethylaminomethyl(34) synthesis GTPase MnmE [Oscillospiraceae bacterium]
MAMLQNDTIAAIATPYAVGSIGIIRLSGEKAKNIVSSIFVPVGERNLYNVNGFSGVFGKIVDGENVIDEAVVFVYNSPRSYTGEDIVEISCHGGLYITKRILRLCYDKGARPAQGGEFTKRALLNGKLSLTQAEAVMDIISANGEQSAKAAISAKDGAIYTEIKEIEKILISASGHLAAWVDYPEEDIEEIGYASLEKDLRFVKEKLQKLIKSYDVGQIVKNGVKTVIVGKPNVGKSTLMNMLSGTEKSIVTEIAGTTRDVVEDVIYVGDVVLNIADTAGIRETDDPVESAGVLLANKRLENSYLILAVFDGSKELTKDDIELLEKLQGKQVIGIINKSDLGKNIDIELIKSKIKHIVDVSAMRGDGKQQLIDCVNSVLSLNQVSFSDAVVANERQRACVMKAIENVEEALNAVLMQITLDAVNVCIDFAIDSLLELTGEKACEAVVNEVFSKFCVGK